jgi:hypothetical protein
MRDEHSRTFCEHGGIWLLELNKFQAGLIETEQQRWLRFFKEGESLNDEALPDWMRTQYPLGASPIRYPSDGV